MTLIDTVQRFNSHALAVESSDSWHRHASVSPHALDTPSVQTTKTTQAFVSSDGSYAFAPGVQSMMESSYTAEFRCAYHFPSPHNTLSSRICSSPYGPPVLPDLGELGMLHTLNVCS